MRGERVTRRPTNGAAVPPPQGPELLVLLQALEAVRNGDFSARLPQDWTGLEGKIADRFNDDGSVWLKVLVNPLVNLIWVAGIVFLFGSVIAMWPDAREQVRLARRFGPAPVPGR